MARLAAIEKALYYPTPNEVIDTIARMVRPHEGDVSLFQPPPGNLLDPCAGEGTAAAQIARAWGMGAYGVELDATRAAVAATKMNCLRGSYHQLRTTPDYTALFLNPPYDEGLSADGQSIRQEVQFLRDCTEWLAPGGLLVYIVPRKILRNDKALDILQRKYCDIAVWQFPEPEYGPFKQVVVLARKSSGYYSSGNTDALRAEVLPVLDETAEYRWRAPSRANYKFYIELEGDNPLELCPDTDEGVFGSKAWDLLVGKRGAVPDRPLVAPRPGHRAMLLAAGSLDGAELEGNKLLKGGSEKIIEQTTEVSINDEGCEVKTVTERERIVSRLAVLDLTTGECDAWRVDQEADKTAAWFQVNGPALAEAIIRCHTPAYDGDLTPYRDRLGTLTAPGILPGRDKPEILPIQAETAAAVVHRWKQNKTAIVSGEMGTGKTTIATVACELRSLGKVVVVCPGHLTSKWKREVEKITGRKGTAMITKKLSDLDSFFEGTASYLILSKETAKLGCRWEPRYAVRRVQISMEVIDTEHPNYRPRGGAYQPKKWIRQILEVVSCPDCGKAQMAGEHYVTVNMVDSKVKSACQVDTCKSPLWQVAPLSARGTMRWPLAERLSQKYARRYSLIVDECFPGDTLISTTNGDVPIKDVKVGDMVWSRSLAGEKVARKVVRHIPKRRDQELVRVTHEHGSFVCTPDHKIWTVEVGYVKAAQFINTSSWIGYIGDKSDANQDLPSVQYTLCIHPKNPPRSQDLQPRMRGATALDRASILEFQDQQRLASRAGGTEGCGTSRVSTVVPADRHDEWVYDLEVEDTHCYFADGVLVSNCHQYAGADSDQSRAVQDLVSGARKVLAMTGTLYGGRASSIFFLLFKVEPSFRAQYAYSDSERFSTHHGLFETKFETKETISTYGYKRGGKEMARTREIPGMAPAMVPLLLPYTVFVKLRDLQLELPPYEETVQVVDHLPEVESAVRRLQEEIKKVLREHPEALGAYLQACLGYPDRAEEAEDVQAHDSEGRAIHLASAPAFDLPDDGMWPKDKTVIELAVAEREAGRKTLVFCTQVHRRDARQRLRAALEAAGLRVAVMDSSVQPDKREAWLTAAAETCDVLLTNGKLVETGLDLLAFPTIVQYGIEYSLATLRQSIRRSWRLGQREPVKVVFLCYRGTMQETALNLIARKMRAAELVDGDEAGGLAQFDAGGSDFFLELAHEAIVQAEGIAVRRAA